MFFHNCFNYLHHSNAERKAVDFTILIEEKNSDSYLSAGEMPLPALYQMLSILFFLSGCFWVFILKKNGSEQVFRIHWIMAALVFLKSLSLFFHGVNYNKIATNGRIWRWSTCFLFTNYKESTWSPGQSCTTSLICWRVVCSSSLLVRVKVTCFGLRDFFSSDWIWLGFCETCAVKQREESVHGGSASAGHLQCGLHHPGGVWAGGSKYEKSLINAEVTLVFTYSSQFLEGGICLDWFDLLWGHLATCGLVH